MTDETKDLRRAGVPEFGEPTEHIPLQRSPQLSQVYWERVVEHLKQNPGQWIPLADPPLAFTRLRNIASAYGKVRSGSGEAHHMQHIPIPLRGLPQLQCRYAGKKLYFRYDPPVESTARVENLRSQLAHIPSRRFA